MKPTRRQRLGHFVFFLSLCLVPGAECQSKDETEPRRTLVLDNDSFASNLFLRLQTVFGPTSQRKDASRPKAPTTLPNNIEPLDSKSFSFNHLPDLISGPKSDAPRLRGGFSTGSRSENTQTLFTTNTDDSEESRRYLEDPSIAEAAPSLEPQDNMDTALKRDEQGDDSGVNWEKKYIGASLKNWLIGAACVFVVLASMCNIFTFCSFVWHCGRLADNSKQGDGTHVEKEKSQFDANDGCSSTSPSSPEADEPTPNT